VCYALGMTKADKRKARKIARKAGDTLTGELVLDRGRHESIEFTDTTRGYRARDKWARHYDNLNGAPEGDWDR